MTKMLRYVFRGTSRKYKGGHHSQSLPVTCASLNPAKAALFAAACARFGDPVIYICKTQNLSDVPTIPSNVLKKLEEEIVFEMKPFHFHERCDNITLEQAQKILENMGIKIQTSVDLSNLSQHLKQVRRMTKKEIESFCKTALK
jgi:hypothetical protein